MTVTAIVLLSCVALAAAGYAPAAPSQSYGTPAVAAAPAPLIRAAAPVQVVAAAPTVQFVPVAVPVPAFRALTPGVHAIPVVPFPGVGRAVVQHFTDKVGAVANHVGAVANHVARTVAFAGEAVNNIARSIVDEKAALLAGLSPAIAPANFVAGVSGASADSGVPSSVVFTPESLAVSAPPAGLAPPVTEYGAGR